MTGGKHSRNVLSLENLTVGYRSGKMQNAVIKEITLNANTGELICFMGPNGVGKSTLLRTICRLQKPLSGSIEIEGQNIEQIATSTMARSISLVLTDRVNAGNLSGYELVALGRYPYLGWNVKINAEDQLQIETAIEQTNTSDFIDKKVYELSDGQLQKIMIARALAQDTPIMILDEPTAHLDLNNRVSMVNLLKNLAHTTEKTIIMATHELDLALQTADKLWLAGINQPMKVGIPEDLVLNGDIDRVFQLKGYDLKTGRLTKPSLGYKVNLIGEGHFYLWTKNALERNGFEIDNKAEVSVEIDNHQWRIKNESANYRTLENLINQLIMKF